jgi:apolipoprotein N-acyltransferase
MAALAVGTNGAPAVAEATRGPRRATRVAIGSGLALAAAFPSLDLEPLAWIALVPLLLAVRGLAPGAAFGLGWLSGLVFYVTTTYWIVHTIGRYTALPLVAAVGVLLAMCSVLACYTGAFVATLRWLARRGLPAVWLAAPLWVTLEWLRSWFFIGFPWGTLGYSQYRYLDLVQMAEVTGVYGVSAVLVLFNAVVAGVVSARGAEVRRLVPALVAATVLMVGLPLAGRWRLAELAALPPAGALRVAVAQGNVAQDQKWDPAFQGETMRRYAELTAAAAAAEPDLVVWPETATPFFFQEAGPLRDQVLDLALDRKVWILFGAPAFRQDERGVVHEQNRAYLVSPDGREVATYDKIQLVPFGEYVPFQRILFFVTQVVEAIGTMEPGRTSTVFELPRARFGALICYEGIFPPLARRLVAGGADFLVNVTNDAWYGRTSAPAQHLAQATLRAVENRVPLVRAANTGISAIVEPSGRIRWQGPLYETLWHADRISWPGVRTFYTRFGDVFVRACVAAVAIALALGIARRPSTGGGPEQLPAVSA